ncbi:MAG: ribonuclease domain-containing protein [Haloechinothrix sp.]
MFSRTRITAALIGLIVLVVGGWLVRDVVADGGPGAIPDVDSGFDVVELSSLPPEARQTWELIEADGPFPYRQDGSVFGNREGLLPRKSSGYYREYTVATTGGPDRGARRLVTGSAGELYYTRDHYESFVVVDQEK